MTLKTHFFTHNIHFFSGRNQSRERKMGVTHEKWVFDPKNPNLVMFLRSNAHNFA